METSTTAFGAAVPEILRAPAEGARVVKGGAAEAPEPEATLTCFSESAAHLVRGVGEYRGGHHVARGERLTGQDPESVRKHHRPGAIMNNRL